MQKILIDTINFLYELINTIFPSFAIEGSILNNITGGILELINYLKAVNFLVPISDIFIVIFLEFNIRLFLLGVFGSNWIVRRIFDVIP